MKSIHSIFILISLCTIFPTKTYDDSELINYHYGSRLWKELGFELIDMIKESPFSLNSYFNPKILGMNIEEKIKKFPTLNVIKLYHALFKNPLNKEYKFKYPFFHDDITTLFCSPVGLEKDLNSFFDSMKLNTTKDIHVMNKLSHEMIIHSLGEKFNTAVINSRINLIEEISKCDDQKIEKLKSLIAEYEKIESSKKLSKMYADHLIQLFAHFGFHAIIIIGSVISGIIEGTVTKTSIMKNIKKSIYGYYIDSFKGMLSFKKASPEMAQKIIDKSYTHLFPMQIYAAMKYTDSSKRDGLFNMASNFAGKMIHLGQIISSYKAIISSIIWLLKNINKPSNAYLNKYTLTQKIQELINRKNSLTPEETLFNLLEKNPTSNFLNNSKKLISDCNYIINDKKLLMAQRGIFNTSLTGYAALSLNQKMKQEIELQIFKIKHDLLHKEALLEEILNNFILTIKAALLKTELVKKSKKETPYCIAQKLDPKNNKITLENFYSPRYAVKDTPVLNSIQNIQNMNIVGPNASGKSAFLRTLITCQAFMRMGILPATSGYMPLRVLLTSLGVSDSSSVTNTNNQSDSSTSIFDNFKNWLKGSKKKSKNKEKIEKYFKKPEKDETPTESRGINEVAFMLYVIDKYKNHQNRPLILMDEILSSTAGTVARSCIENPQIAPIFSLGNNITTTHFIEVADLLEKDQRFKFTSFFTEMEYSVDRYGTNSILKYTRKILPGTINAIKNKWGNIIKPDNRPLNEIFPNLSNENITLFSFDFIKKAATYLSQAKQDLLS